MKKGLAWMAIGFCVYFAFAHWHAVMHVVNQLHLVHK